MSVEAGREVTPCRENYAAMLLLAPTRSRECPKRDGNPANGLIAPETKSPPLQEKQKKDFLKLTDDAGMSMETKDRCGKLGVKAGMCMKAKIVSR